MQFYKFKKLFLGTKKLKQVSEVEILNPEQTICNVDEKTNFHMKYLSTQEKCTKK